MAKNGRDAEHLVGWQEVTLMEMLHQLLEHPAVNYWLSWFEWMQTFMSKVIHLCPFQLDVSLF